MISRLLSDHKPPAKPRRPGRPRTAEAELVRECADAVGRGKIPVAQIAAKLGVHRTTVYKWIRSENAA